MQFWLDELHIKHLHLKVYQWVKKQGQKQSLLVQKGPMLVHFGHHLLQTNLKFWDCCVRVRQISSIIHVICMSSKRILHFLSHFVIL